MSPRAVGPRFQAFSSNVGSRSLTSQTSMKQPSLTIGVEEEYQIIDPQTRELQSYITQLLEYDHRFLGQVKPELHQSIVEVGTTVCRTPQEVREELVRLRRGVMELAGLKNLSIAAAGTHPFSHWVDQEITPLERYIGTQDAMQDLARQLLIFGTHVHIGIEDRDFLIDAANVARYFLPHILCLSTSSPFWIGRNTGLKSYRSVVFRAFPRSGVTPVLRGWSDYQTYLETLIATNTIPDGSKVWWDVRPHWKYPTLEFRVCDVFTRVDEAVSVAAILQAIVAKLWKMRRDNITFRVYPSELIDWFIADVVDELGSRKDVEYAYKILEEGSSADRQIAVYDKTGDIKAVVDHLIAESREGVVTDDAP